MPRLLCIGMGYTAHVAAEPLRAQGFDVVGTGRRSGAIHYLAGSPSDELKRALQAASHLLISIPPEEDGCQVFRDIYSHISARTEWIGYLSTTGVYGDYKGAWVNEMSATHPTEPRSIARLVAEKQWKSIGAHIFRLAGIYGPMRNVFEKIQNGTAQRIDAGYHVSSRIHVEDIAQVLIASMQHPSPESIYNVADDLPCASADLVSYACELLGIKVPPPVALKEAGLSPMAYSFYQTSRRVDNSKIKKELGVVLRYPSYREGLQALMQSGTALANKAV